MQRIAAHDRIPGAVASARREAVARGTAQLDARALAARSADGRP